MEYAPRNTGWRHYALLVLGSAILAFGLFNIHSRTQITEGGILGLSLLLHHWLHISPGILGFVLDSICYLLGLKVLGWRFLKNALFASACYAISYQVFEHLGYMLPDLTPWPLAAALAGGAFVGVGVGIVVREGGAAGGDDALALMISRAARCRISRAYFLTDFIVLMLSLSYIPVRRILFSLLTVTLSSFLIDQIQRFGLSSNASPSKSKQKAAP